MMSARGFLQSRGPGLPPRMTKRQAQAVSLAVFHALEHAANDLAQSALAGDERKIRSELGVLTRMVVRDALEAYPHDRSCFTCDMLHGQVCRHWKQEVPKDALERGCDHHQEQGAPF